MRRFPFLLAALLAAPLAHAQTATPVAPGASILRDLGPSDRHAYTLTVPARTFVTGAAVQHTVDVVVKIVSPAGDTLATLDTPARGPEPFDFTAEAAGTYRIEVTPFQGATGRYTFDLTRAEPVATTPEGRVAQLFAGRDRPDVPATSVAVIRGDRVVFAQQYGMANLAHGVRATPETGFNVASVSKQFTGFALVLLQQQGKLSLDDDVRKHLPELRDFGQTITLRHLLNHTSGLREILNLELMSGWHGDGYLPPDAAFRVAARQAALQNAPGAEYNYNNTGYELLGAVVARVGGKPFDVWMTEHVFAPLGMAHTRIRMTQGQVIPGAADGYRPAQAGGVERAVDIASAYGASSIVTTAADLARWLVNMRDGRIGGMAAQAALRTRGVTTGGDTLSYALGVLAGPWRGTRRVAHDGGENGFATFIAHYPDLDAGVIVLAAEAGFPATERAGAVMEAFFGDRLAPANSPAAPAAPTTAGAVPFVPTRFDAFAGAYELGPGFTLTFTRNAARYYVQATGQQRFELFPSSDSTFFLTVVPASVTFHRASGSPVGRITWHQGGDAPGHRVASWTPPADSLAAYAGRYYSDELDASYTVEVQDGKLVATNRRLDTPLPLTPSKPDTFTSRAPLLEVRFERDAGGSITALLGSYGRTRGIRFERMR